MILIHTLVFGLYSLVLIEAIYISPCAKWNPEGITIAGSNSQGNASNQLNTPQGIFIHKETNTLYVADTGNRRVQMFALDQSSTTGVTVASNIDSMSGIYVDDDGVTIYVALRYENRVERWIKGGASRGEQVGDQCKQCTGVWMDAEKNIYMVESGTHSILKLSAGTSTITSIAGQTDSLGQTADRLYFPRSIYINRINGALYVADMMNNRIQKWNRNAQEGITVAGLNNGTSGYDTSKLASPSYVWVDDETDTVYIADNDNDRIQRWLPQESTGTTIAGGAGRGNSNNQLFLPNGLAFDNLGNLYVCDGNNHRVQRFQLVDNQICSITTSSYSTATTISMNTFLVLSWIVHVVIS